jgi:hypothetical protein
MFSICIEIKFIATLRIIIDLPTYVVRMNSNQQWHSSHISVFMVVLSMSQTEDEDVYENFLSSQIWEYNFFVSCSCRKTK